MEPTPVKFPQSPGTPLFPLSPERVNGARPPYGSIPQSPSMPEFIKPSEFELNPGSPKRTVHSRNNSEALVQGMVARFDSLTLKDHQQMHKRDEVAIKRAEMAREMAELELKRVREEREEKESEAKKWREECRRMKKEMEEGRDKERKIMKRLEAQTDDIERSSKTGEHQRAVLEKETRRLRKEAYKTESALVKVQEELKATRNLLRVAQAGVESEKAKSFRREQEAFAAEYKLVGAQEELSKAQERIKVIEEERDTLKTSLREEEVARIAAEGRIALPASADDGDDEFASPKRSPRKKSPESDSDGKENVAPKRVVEVKALQQELDVQRRLRRKAEDQVEFMKMECQFQCCSCRVAEQRGASYVHDNSFDEQMLQISHDYSHLPDEAVDETQRVEADQEMADEAEIISQTKEAGPIPSQTQPLYDDVKENLDPEARPSSSSSQQPRLPLATGQKGASNLSIAVKAYEDQQDALAHMDEALATTADPEESTEASPSPVKEESEDVAMASVPETPRAPHTPKYREVRTITTTTTIPLAITPSSTPAQAASGAAIMTPVTIPHPPALKATPASPFPASPGAALRPDGTLDREAALEQIRLRRGRARSVAMGLGTPRKQMIEGIGRRDISAPALKGRC